jgi:hypothetical protein
MHARLIPLALASLSFANTSIAQSSLSEIAKDPPPSMAPASPELCAQLAATLRTAPFETWLVFNSMGAICHAPPVLRQRDRMRFALALAKGETVPDSASVTLTGCTVPSPTPSVLQSGPLPFTKQSDSSGKKDKAAEPKIIEVPMPAACESSNPVMVTNVGMRGEAALTQNIPLSLYPRHAAVIHLGVLNSRLREPEFGLRASGAQTVIVDKETDQRGPEYVGVVVVQAIPRYFTAGLSYPGRDLQHDNHPADRLGLALSFGLKDPTKRFGVGLGYEIANGINLVAVREWVKRPQLAGVRLGDQFTGTAAEIPSRNEWSKAWAVGLTFDVAYITSIFSGGKK